jgi:lipoprotein-anchoring transpeptidase ErfK/SrfK
MRGVIVSLVLGLMLAGAGYGGTTEERPWLERVNDATPEEVTKRKDPSPAIIRAQVLLDRAAISPGVIDGYDGGNTRKALRVFQLRNRLRPTGVLDTATWEALIGADSAPVLMEYTITEKDVAGPFVEAIPAGMREMGKLERLDYTSPRELLAEKFHLDEDLLERMNPEVDFSKAGAKIVVADVRGPRPEGPAVTVVVDRQNQSVKPYAADGRLIAFYPATVGSSTFPSPSGDLEVVSVAENPEYTYSARLEFSDLKEGERAIRIAPGPNNPVGSIWIGLSRRGFGIHGTPHPSKIGKQSSHGCVRLTNWDARELAFLVKKGVTVQFR